MAAQAPNTHAAAPGSFMGFTLNHASNMIFLSQVAAFCLYGGCTTFDTPYGAYQAGSASTAGSFSGTPDDNVLQQPGQMSVPWNATSAVQPANHLFIALAVFVALPLVFVARDSSTLKTVGHAFLLATTAVQWAILGLGFWWNGNLTRTVNPSGWQPIPINYNLLLNATYIAATVLVSYSAFAGRVSFAQAYFISIFEVFFATANFIIIQNMQVLDSGGAGFIHTFGGAFGITASLLIFTTVQPVKTLAGTRTRDNQVFALIGAALAFVLLPIFNIGSIQYMLNTGSYQPGNWGNAASALQFRGYFNTIVAEASAIAAAFCISKARSARGETFSVWHIQGAVVAGAASIATAGPMLANPWGAMITGAVTGTLYVFVKEFGVHVLPTHDATGTLATHLVPGIIGGLAAAVASARVSVAFSWTTANINAVVLAGRDSRVQGGYQIAYTAISFGFGLLAGLFTGVLANFPYCCNARVHATYADEDEYDAIEGAQPFAPTDVAPAPKALPATPAAPAAVAHSEVAVAAPAPAVTA